MVTGRRRQKRIDGINPINTNFLTRRTGHLRRLGKGSSPQPQSPYTLATLVATQPYGGSILFIDPRKMSIVSGPDQQSEKTAPYANGVRITDEELFHRGTYVGDDPMLKAAFAGSWLQV